MYTTDSLALALEKLGFNPMLIRSLLHQLGQQGQISLILDSIPFDEYEICSQDGEPLKITVKLRKSSPRSAT